MALRVPQRDTHHAAQILLSLDGQDLTTSTPFSKGCRTSPSACHSAGRQCRSRRHKPPTSSSRVLLVKSPSGSLCQCCISPLFTAVVLVLSCLQYSLVPWAAFGLPLRTGTGKACYSFDPVSAASPISFHPPSTLPLVTYDTLFLFPGGVSAPGFRFPST